MSQRICQTCNKATSTRCSACKSVYYCSRQCQTQDAKHHSSKCRLAINPDTNSLFNSNASETQGINASIMNVIRRDPNTISAPVQTTPDVDVERYFSDDDTENNAEHTNHPETTQNRYRYFVMTSDQLLSALVSQISLNNTFDTTNNASQAPTYDIPPEEDEPELSSDDPEICTICYTRRIVTAMVPCGHCVTCVNCARSLKTSDSFGKSCPICRKDIQSIIRIRNISHSAPNVEYNTNNLWLLNNKSIT